MTIAEQYATMYIFKKAVNEVCSKVHKATRSNNGQGRRRTMAREEGEQR
jgi:hypothetical protein